MRINVIQKVQNANDILAQANRQKLQQAGILAVNLISAPGSGKTTLLQKTMAALAPQKAAAIVGDLETTRDAERLKVSASQVSQINTGMSCHLYASQVGESLKAMDLSGIDYVFIENVGNMVCPGEFDLGENLKAVLLSVPEGDDKVAKYPTIFRVADVVLLTKVDLLSVLSFDLGRVREDLAKLNANVPLISLSSQKGEGMAEWLAWLKAKKAEGVAAQARYWTGA